MKTFERRPISAPDLDLLIERGVLSRALLAESKDYAVESFAAEAELAVARGAVTRDQARMLGRMLGVPAP